MSIPGVIERSRIPADDGTSMAKARDRSQEALAHADGLYNLARYLTGREQEAEDLVQETYTRAFGAIARLQPDSNVKAWLYQILRNAHISQWRRRRNDPLVPGLDAALAPVEADALRRVVARDIEAALMTLSDEARMVILLDLEGFTEAEMADIMDCATGTVKSRLHRARAALRARLAEYGP